MTMAKQHRQDAVSVARLRRQHKRLASLRAYRGEVRQANRFNRLTPTLIQEAELSWANVAAWPRVEVPRPAPPPPTSTFLTECECEPCLQARKIKEKRAALFEQRNLVRQAKQLAKSLVRGLKRTHRWAKLPALDPFRTWCGIPIKSTYDALYGEDPPIEMEDLEVREDEPITDDEPVRSYVRRSKRRYTPGEERILREPVYKECTEPLPAPRSESLLKKLRSAISQKRNGTVERICSTVLPSVVEGITTLETRSPSVSSCEEATESPLDRLRPYLKPESYAKRKSQQVKMWAEMDLENDEVRLEQKSNVVLQEAVEPEIEVIGHKLGNLKRFCEADTVSPGKEVDRWIPVGAFTWNSTQATDSDLVDLDLPRDAFYQVKTDAQGQSKITWIDNVLTNYFRVRQYCQTDLELRVIINSSPFMLGQAQVTWYYQPEADQNFVHRSHNCVISQNHHAILDASDSGSASIIVPYRNFRTYMNIYEREDMDHALYLGKLLVKVLVPLQVPTGACTNVDGTVLMRMMNCDLMGMVPPGLTPVAKAEMFAALAAGQAALHLYKEYKDINRDKPPEPASARAFMPQSTGSLACGTKDVEHVHPMRLDALGQVPHPEGSPDEFNLKFVASQWGLLRTFKIPSTATNGQCVFCEDAAPLLRKEAYYKYAIQGTDCYGVPPIGVCSSLYAYFRGDIEFRFDVVATRFHQLRLLFVWVPNYTGQLTYKQAQSCAGTYFDLKENERSVVIRVPYVGDKCWWPHRYTNGVMSEEYKAPSRFCCFVVNRLTCTNAVPPSVTLVPYMRAADNFELAIPVQPMLGLSFFPQFKNMTDDYTTAYPGYFPYYLGVWRNFEGSTEGILRYGPGSDHIVQFTNLKAFSVYTFKDEKLAKTLTFTDSGGRLMDASKIYFVPVDVKDGFGYRYLAGIRSLSNVNKFWYTYDTTKKQWSKRKEPDYDQCISMGSTSSNTYYSPANINAILTRTEVPIPVDPPTLHAEIMSSGGSIVFETTSSSSASRMTFGEDFCDFKDMCRRYQLYAYLELKSITSQLALIDYSIPILPQGLDLHPLQSDVQNMARDGIIPLLLSGYRFYRGGLRFKFMPSLSSDGFNYMVQVRPDRTLRTCNPRAGGKTVADSVYQHGYAMAVQAASVNPILTVEVPFYQPFSSGLLQRPNESRLTNPEISRAVSLGEMTLSCSFALDKMLPQLNPTMTILYSIADDFSPHTWQGFPLVIFIGDSQLTHETTEQSKFNISFEE